MIDSFTKLSTKLHNIIGYTGYWGFFVMTIIESTAIPVVMPAEAVLLLAGYFVGTKELDFTLTLIVCIAGSMVGSLINYCIGYFFGRPLLEKYGKYLFITKAKLAKLEAVFNEYSGIIIFVSRFLPLVKHIGSIPPGLSKTNPIKFAVYTLSGISIFTFVVMYVGVKIGENAQDISKIKTYLAVGAIGFVVISIALYYIYNLFANKATMKESVEKKV